jgi:hypothetical protein
MIAAGVAANWPRRSTPATRAGLLAIDRLEVIGIPQPIHRRQRETRVVQKEWYCSKGLGELLDHGAATSAVEYVHPLSSHGHAERPRRPLRMKMSRMQR